VLPPPVPPSSARKSVREIVFPFLFFFFAVLKRQNKHYSRIQVTYRVVQYSIIKYIYNKSNINWALNIKWGPATLATQEAEIRRIVVQSQHGKIVLETLS
jgi:hypothetical protein